MTGVPNPTRDHLDHGVEYCFDPDGTVERRPGVLCWRLDVTSRFFRSECVFTDPEGKSVVAIRRSKFWPAEFLMVEQGQTVGTIRRLNVLRTRYTVTLAEGATWNVHVPLYRMRFHAISSCGAQIFVVLAPVVRWYVLTEPRSNEPRILMALAFIYRAWGGRQSREKRGCSPLKPGSLAGREGA